MWNFVKLGYIELLVVTNVVYCKPSAPQWSSTQQSSSMVDDSTKEESGNTTEATVSQIPSEIESDQHNLSGRRSLQDRFFEVVRSPYCDPEVIVDYTNHSIGYFTQDSFTLYLLPGRLFKFLTVTVKFVNGADFPKEERLQFYRSELCINDPYRGYTVRIDIMEFNKHVSYNKWGVRVRANCGRSVEKEVDKAYQINWLQGVFVEAFGFSFWRTSPTPPICLGPLLHPGLFPHEPDTWEPKGPIISDAATNFYVLLSAFGILCLTGLFALAAVLYSRRPGAPEDAEPNREQNIQLWETLVANNFRPVQSEDSDDSSSESQEDCHDTENSLYNRAG